MLPIPLSSAIVTCLAFYKQPLSHADKVNAFINSLKADQKKLAVLPFYGLSGRAWAFIPNYGSRPPGSALNDMNAGQQQKAHALLQSYLRVKGYGKAKSIMDLEYVLKEIEPNNPARIPGDYVVIIYGTPNEDSAWAWAFQAII